MVLHLFLSLCFAFSGLLVFDNLTGSFSHNYPVLYWLWLLRFAEMKLSFFEGNVNECLVIHSHPLAGERLFTYNINIVNNPQILCQNTKPSEPFVVRLVDSIRRSTSASFVVYHMHVRHVVTNSSLLNSRDCHHIALCLVHSVLCTHSCFNYEFI